MPDSSVFFFSVMLEILPIFGCFGEHLLEFGICDLEFRKVVSRQKRSSCERR